MKKIKKPKTPEFWFYIGRSSKFHLCMIANLFEPKSWKKPKKNLKIHL